jgi:hypothetical protein
MTIEKRVSALEKALTAHLEESGTIRTDLAWLKKAFWTMTGALVTFNFAVVAAIVARFIK